MTLEEIYILMLKYWIYKMANDNGLIDPYEELQNKKKELDIRKEELKKDIIKLSQEKKYINLIWRP